MDLKWETKFQMSSSKFSTSKYKSNYSITKLVKTQIAVYEFEKKTDKQNTNKNKNKHTNNIFVKLSVPYENDPIIDPKANTQLAPKPNHKKNHYLKLPDV